MTTPLDAQPIELSITEDALFAELGRLYFKNQLLHQRVVRLQMEAAQAVTLPDDGADDDDVPGDGDNK